MGAVVRGALDRGLGDRQAHRGAGELLAAWGTAARSGRGRRGARRAGRAGPRTSSSTTVVAVAERGGRAPRGRGRAGRARLVPGDGAVEVGDGQVDGAQRERRGEHLESRSRSCVQDRRGARRFPMATPRRYMDISVDRLPAAAAGRAARGRERSADAAAARRARAAPARLPRADLDARAATGEHSIDGERFAVAPGHGDADRARPGARVRARAAGSPARSCASGAEMLLETAPGWLVGGRGSRHGDGPALGGAGAGGDDRDARGRGRAARGRRAALDLQRHLLSVLLLWVERWYDADAHRAPRPRRRRRPALPPLRQRARARLRPPPRRRPLRRRARACRPPRSRARSPTSPAARPSS